MARPKKRYDTISATSNELITLKVLVDLILADGHVYPHKTPRERQSSVRSAIRYHVKQGNVVRNTDGRFPKAKALLWANQHWSGCIQTTSITDLAIQRTKTAFVDARVPTQQHGIVHTATSNNLDVVQLELSKAQSEIRRLTYELEQYREDALKYRNWCERNRETANRRWKK